MTSSRAPAAFEDRVRETYEEFDVDDGHVALLSDPENPYAWIESDLTVPVDA